MAGLRGADAGFRKEESGMASRTRTDNTGSTTRRTQPARQGGTQQRQTSAGEIADMPDLSDMFPDGMTVPHGTEIPTTTSGRVSMPRSVTGNARTNGSPRTSGSARGDGRRQQTDATMQARRRTSPPRGTRVTPSADAGVRGIASDDDMAEHAGFLGWYIEHQWVSYVIATVSIVIGMLTNRYVSVVVAILLLGVGYLAEQQDVDDDAMPTYIAAMLAFFVPFVY